MNCQLTAFLRFFINLPSYGGENWPLFNWDSNWVSIGGFNPHFNWKNLILGSYFSVFIVEKGVLNPKKRGFWTPPQLSIFMGGTSKKLELGIQISQVLPLKRIPNRVFRQILRIVQPHFPGNPLTLDSGSKIGLRNESTLGSVNFFCERWKNSKNFQILPLKRGAQFSNIGNNTRRGSKHHNFGQ